MLPARGVRAYPGGKQAAAVPALDSLGVTKHLRAGSITAQRQCVLALLHRGLQCRYSPSRLRSCSQQRQLQARQATVPPPARARLTTHCCSCSACKRQASGGKRAAQRQRAGIEPTSPQAVEATKASAANVVRRVLVQSIQTALGRAAGELAVQDS